jgi:hypothetical protein
MKRTMTVIVMVTVLMAGATPARADTTETVGFWTMIGGVGLMFAAFNYSDDCPAGYTRHTFEHYTTQCVTVSRYGSDVRDAGSVEFARPGIMWASLGLVGGGIVLMLLPEKARKAAPSVAVTPKGVTATKTVTW